MIELFGGVYFVEQLVFALLFLVAFIFNINKTFFILMVAAICNLFLFQLYLADSVIYEATVNMVFLSLLIAFGSSQKRYQVTILGVCLFANMLMEIDLTNILLSYGFISGDSNLIFSDYDAVISILTVLQLLGGLHGAFARLFERLWKPDNNSFVYSRSLHTVENKACPKS